MSFSFKCRHCGIDIQAEESWEGKQMSCPKCGQMVAIPPPGQETAPVHGVPTDTPPAPAPVTSGMAVASMVLGILSFVFPFIGVIPVALILGIIARGKINKSNGLLKGKGMAITGIVCNCVFLLVFVVFILAAILLPALSKGHVNARDFSCLNNLKMFGLALVMFTDDNNQLLPEADECKAKIFEYVGDEKPFHCPASNIPGDSYRFFVNGTKLNSLSTNPRETIMAICTSTHTKNRVHILFADGHVESRDKNEVDTTIQNVAPGTMPVLK